MLSGKGVIEMEVLLKRNEATEIAFPMIDDTTPEDFKTGLTVADAPYSKEGAGAWTSRSITDPVTEIGATGMYQISLTAGELDYDYLIIKFTAADAADQMVSIKTYVNDIDDVNTVVDAIQAVTDNLPNSGALTDIDTGINNIEAKLPAGTISDFDYTSEAVAIAVDGILAASLADAAVTKITDDIMAEIIDDTVDFATAIRKVLSYAIGNITKVADAYTYDQQDDSTPDFTLTLAASTRTRS